MTELDPIGKVVPQAGRAISVPKDVWSDPPYEKYLPVNLTLEETDELGKELAEAERDLQKQIDAKKADSSRRNEAIKSQRELVQALTSKRINGVETRPVMCVKTTDITKNLVTIVRQDTGETVDTRALTAEERQGAMFETVDDTPEEEPGDGVPDGEFAEVDAGDAPPDFDPELERQNEENHRSPPFPDDGSGAERLTDDPPLPPGDQE